MAKNQHLRYAQHLDLPVPDGVKSGEPVLVGAFVGIAITDRRQDGNASVWRDGSWHLVVPEAVTAVGTAVYIGTNRKLSTTKGDGTLFGYTLATKSAGETTIPVAIAQV